MNKENFTQFYVFSLPCRTTITHHTASVINNYNLTVAVVSHE